MEMIIVQSKKRTGYVETNTGPIKYEYTDHEAVGTLHIPDGPWNPSEALTQVAAKLQTPRNTIQFIGAPVIEYKAQQPC